MNKAKEKKAGRIRLVILIFVGLAAIGLVYYFLVYNVVEREIDSLREQKTRTEDSLTSIQAQVAMMQRMEKELESMDLSSVSRMESYNNSKAELAYLNHVLESTMEYAITFQRITRDGDQIRRSFNLVFLVPSYESAENIISLLQQSEYRCLVGNISYTTSRDRYSEAADYVQMSVDATFFETMVGGVRDAGLSGAQGN